LRRLTAIAGVPGGTVSCKPPTSVRLVYPEFILAQHTRT
jgi:hypothetical protein